MSRGRYKKCIKSKNQSRKINRLFKNKLTKKIRKIKGTKTLKRNYISKDKVNI